MPRGIIKWFNEKKGYGFIQQETGGPDVFAHYTNIKSEGFRTLAEGQLVEFDLVDDVKGAKALNIVFRSHLLFRNSEFANHEFFGRFH
jgi:cold shock protein